MTKLTDKNISIFKRSLPKSEFSCRALEVVSLITKLRDFLYENKKDYIDSIGLLGIKQSKMSALDRDKIDKEAETFMKTCRDAINRLSTLVRNQQCTTQAKENNENIMYYLELYLINVSKIYSEQKSLRINRLLDKKRISRLEPDERFLRKYPDLFKLNKENSTNNGNTDEGPSLRSYDLNQDEPIYDSSSVESAKRKSIILDDNLFNNSEEPINLTYKEKIMLQLENERLYNEMSGMVDELKLIEGNIVEISKLQEIFTENVLQQEKDIYRVADNIVGTTENIKGANVEIREAMKNKAGLLVWILFFLIVNTFSLLFLDWYND